MTLCLTDTFSTDNNLSIANLGLEEFIGMVDETGVFRGLPDMRYESVSRWLLAEHCFPLRRSL
jgi:Domain of unknown function (DUF6924)